MSIVQVFQSRHEYKTFFHMHESPSVLKKYFFGVKTTIPVFLLRWTSRMEIWACVKWARFLNYKSHPYQQTDEAGLICLTELAAQSGNRQLDLLWCCATNMIAGSDRTFQCQDFKYIVIDETGEGPQFFQ